VNIFNHRLLSISSLTPRPLCDAIHHVIAECRVSAFECSTENHGHRSNIAAVIDLPTAHFQG
jgi:hypothetical protein